jgi:O-antigen/teichoic acid export membrane protein
VSRSKKFFGGMLLNYTYQALIMIVGLWLTPFFLRRIGQHDYGLWLVGTQLVTYLTLTDFGVVALLPLETAYATGRAGGATDVQELSQIAGRTFRIVLYQLPIVLVIAIAMWFSLPAEWERLRGPFGVILFGFVAAFPLRIFPALLQGLQDLTFAYGVQLANWVISTAATVAMVLAGWNLYALAAGWLISQTVLTPLFLLRLRRNFPGVVPSRLPAFSWGASRAYLAKGFWVSVAQIAQLLMSNTDVLIIGRFLGPAAVVPYVCTGKLATVLANQAMILMHTAAPGLCEIKTGESRDRLAQVLVALNHIVLTLTGLVFCVVLLVNRWFVTSWVTRQQYGGFILTAAILSSVLIRNWTAVTAYTVFCFGHQRRISLTNLGDGLVTAASCIVLTLLIGPGGAPVGSVLGAAIISLPFNLTIIAKDTDFSVAKLVRAMLGSWLWRFALLIGIDYWIALRWSPKNIPQAAFAAVSVTVIYLSVMLPSVLRSSLGPYVRQLFVSFRARYFSVEARASA